MESYADKIDELVLSLTYMTSDTVTSGTRAWKGRDWETMNRLHEKGYISDPKTKARSVVLTGEGAKLSKELFFIHFGVKKQNLNKTSLD